MIAASLAAPVAASPPRIRVWYRDAEPTDLPYVLDSWRNSWRQSERCRVLRGRDYRPLFDDTVTRGLLALDDTRVMVGCDPANTSAIRCWACYTPGEIPTLHYAVTRRELDGQPMRRIGLLTRLVAAIGVRDAVVYTFQPTERLRRHDRKRAGVEAALLAAADRAGVIARYHTVDEFLRYRRKGALA